MSNDILTDRRDGVAIVTLNRPVGLQNLAHAADQR
jgi:enoyl-CoA hydratase/carnithine racemase